MIYLDFAIFLLTVQIYGGGTLSSCTVSCSTLRITTVDSCNIYYVENGICRAGVLDNAANYSKKAGSSSTLVEVYIVVTSLAASVGEKVKPGCLSGLMETSISRIFATKNVKC